MLELLLYCIAVFTILILYYFYKPIDKTQSHPQLDNAILDDEEPKPTFANKLNNFYVIYLLPLFKYLGLNETNYFNVNNKPKDISLNSSIICNKITDNYR